MTFASVYFSPTYFTSHYFPEGVLNPVIPPAPSPPPTAAAPAPELSGGGAPWDRFAVSREYERAMRRFTVGQRLKPIRLEGRSKRAASRGSVERQIKRLREQAQAELTLRRAVVAEARQEILRHPKSGRFQSLPAAQEYAMKVIGA